VAKIGEKIVSPPTTSKPTMKKGIDVWRMEHKAEIASDAKGRLPGAHNLNQWRGARDEGWKKLKEEEKMRYKLAAAAENEAAKKGPPPGHVHE
jgi:hypothetical protein